VPGERSGATGRRIKASGRFLQGGPYRRHWSGADRVYDGRIGRSLYGVPFSSEGLIDGQATGSATPRFWLFPRLTAQLARGETL